MGIFIIYLLRKLWGRMRKAFSIVSCTTKCCTNDRCSNISPLLKKTGLAPRYNSFGFSEFAGRGNLKAEKTCYYLTIAFSFSWCCTLPTAMCSTGLLQPRRCFLFNYNNCTFVSFASWWWSFVALVLSLIWSRTQKETLWRKSGLPTSAGRFCGYVSKNGLLTSPCLSLKVYVARMLQGYHAVSLKLWFANQEPTLGICIPAVSYFLPQVTLSCHCQPSPLFSITSVATLTMVCAKDSVFTRVSSYPRFANPCFKSWSLLK